MSKFFSVIWIQFYHKYVTIKEDLFFFFSHTHFKHWYNSWRIRKKVLSEDVRKWNQVSLSCKISPQWKVRKTSWSEFFPIFLLSFFFLFAFFLYGPSISFHSSEANPIWQQGQTSDHPQADSVTIYFWYLSQVFFVKMDSVRQIK